MGGVGGSGVGMAFDKTGGVFITAVKALGLVACRCKHSISVDFPVWACACGPILDRLFSGCIHRATAGVDRGPTRL